MRALGARDDDAQAWEVGIADPFDKARTVNTVSRIRLLSQAAIIRDIIR